MIVALEMIITILFGCVGVNMMIQARKQTKEKKWKRILLYGFGLGTVFVSAILYGIALKTMLGGAVV